MIIDNDKMKRLLKEKGINKSQLVDKLGISSRTLAKISKGENISESVVAKICEYLNCQKQDILKCSAILLRLRQELINKVENSLYHMTQVLLTYNSNHIEGSQLTEEQTRFIFETQTIGQLPNNIKLDDIIETRNHFKCIDYVILNADNELNANFIKTLQYKLKLGTQHADNFQIGEYKRFANTVGGIETTNPQNVDKQVNALLKEYNSKKIKTLFDIVEFHYNFEKIHPFQDGNGRIGRLIAFKECLKNDIMPFYIADQFKYEYYQGLSKWNEESNYLLETCQLGQELYSRLVDYFNS